MCSVRKGILRNFAKFTAKHLCQSLFFNKVAGLRLRLWACNFIKKETLAQVFSCKFSKSSKNIFFTEHLWAIASGFCKRRSKSFIEKLSDFTFAVEYGHEKNSFFGSFLFSKPVKVTLDTSVRKISFTKRSLAPNKDPKNYGKNITATRAARCSMQRLKKVRYSNIYI